VERKLVPETTGKGHPDDKGRGEKGKTIPPKDQNGGENGLHAFV